MGRSLAVLLLMFSVGGGRCLLGPYGLNCHHNRAATVSPVMSTPNLWDSMLWDSGEWN